MKQEEQTEQEELGSIFAGLKKPENSRLLLTLKVLLLVILFAFALIVTVTALFFWDYFRKQAIFIAPDNGGLVSPATQPYMILSALGLTTLLSGIFFLVRKKTALAVYVMLVGDLICFILSARM